MNPRRLPKRNLLIVLSLFVVIALIIAGVLIFTHGGKPSIPTSGGGSGSVANSKFYSPQFSRNAEQAGGADNYTQTEIDTLAKNVGIATIPKFADNFNIQQHFKDATNLVTTAKKYNNPIQVLEYYNSTFWYTKNIDGWKPYTDTFNTNWYLKDANGTPISIGKTTTDTAEDDGSNADAGYMLDLSNSDYRKWAVSTIVAWMKAAPYRGVEFDSANMLIGTVTRGSTSKGSTYNDLLCGASAAVDSAGNCNRVNQWNAGLASLMQETSAALHPLGDYVRYNGIAPNPLRGPTRNIALLADADATSDEDFCYHAKARGDRSLALNPLLDDVALMKQIADQNKKVFEITNYQSSDNLKYSSYCLGGFLIGWQPGSSYWIYHQGYSHGVPDAYPIIDEQNLNLGNPTAAYTTSGSVLMRQFTGGFVAVNNSDEVTSFTAPQAITLFKDGKQQKQYSQGDTVTIAARDGMMFLNTSLVQ